MNEQIERLDHSGKKTCRTPGSRPAKRVDACRAMVESSTQHGTGMANSFESPSSKGGEQSCSKADLAGICMSSSEAVSNEAQPCKEGRLVSLGNTSNEWREPLHPEATSTALSKPTGPVSTDNVMRLLDYQHCCCALTGRALTPDLASLDHVIPIRLGGEHLIENTQILHRDVNRSKGTLTNVEFIQLCEEVVAHTRIDIQQPNTKTK
jgi:5-methylcytosine-specific restriction endonuclease McrA